jgi:hypothetical protein
VPAGVAERREGLGAPQTAHAAVSSGHQAKVSTTGSTVCKSGSTSVRGIYTK